MKLNKSVEYILNTLFSAGHRADVVGGPVRDFLLGKSPSDYDITTSATPSRIKEIFSSHKTVDTGIKHGTVSLILDGEQYEITTYRIDGEYRDARHPESVSFTEEISEDLARRDFTVNAMAYNPRDGLTDLYGGREDLKAGIIRAVGDPVLRFSEDALRILRGMRFAATLGFSIDAQTAAAMRKCAHLLTKVSSERIYTEWYKLLGGKSAYSIIAEFSDVISVFLPELSSLKMPNEKRFSETTAFIRQLSLFAPVLSAAADYEAAMRRLKTDNKTRETGYAVLGALRSGYNPTPSSIGRLLYSLGKEAAALLGELVFTLDLDCGEMREAVISYIERGLPYRISDLKIGGRELLSLGISGKAVGDTLTELLFAVIDGRAENTYAALVSYVNEAT